MLLSSIEFGAFLAYAPRGEGDIHRQSQELMRRIKRDAMVRSVAPRCSMARYVARRLREEIAGTALEDYIDRSATLVPVPSSSKLVEHGLWVPRRLCEALVGEGFGARVEPCLERVRAVAKSSTADAKDRPKAKEHYDSMRVDAPLVTPATILLVDDVVTRGATLLGAASRLAETFPKATIRTFAVVRTISDTSQFSKIIAPVRGQITLRGGETFRRP